MDFVFEASKTNICEECEANFTQFIASKSYTYVSIKVVVVGIWKSPQFAKISSTRLIEFERKGLQFWWIINSTTTLSRHSDHIIN